MREGSLKKRTILLISAALALCFIILFTAGGARADEGAAESTVNDGEVTESTVNDGDVPQSNAQDEDVVEGTVYIEDVCVTGMTLGQVEQVCADKLNEYASDDISINVRGNYVSAKAGDFGLYYENTDLPSYVLKLQGRGNVWQRYKMERYVHDRGGLVFALNLRVDEEKVTNTVTSLCSPLDIPRVDMTIQRDESGAFYATEKVDGVYTDVSTTTENICNYMNSDWHGGKGAVNAVITVDEAFGDPEAVSKMDSCLGTGVTSFEINEKNQYRNTNIAVATAKVNGSIVYPGEEFSTITPMMPFTEAEGYVTAPTYEQGQVVDDIGGGICQVSSTLYRAVLEAELEVTERNQHSMIVGYVAPSMDATISEGEKDLKFINTTDAPIYIEGIINGNQVIFNIYGHETRPEGRSVDFESEILKQEPFKTEFALDPSLPFGSIHYTDGHDAVDAVAYKLVYQDGQLESRDKLSTSEYQLGNSICKVGTMGASDEVVAALASAVASQNQDTVNEAIVSSGGTLTVVP